jgi:hypothetical protein
MNTSITLPWSVAEDAYETYVQWFGDNQSLERLAERGGFTAEEFACFVHCKDQTVHFPNNQHTQSELNDMFKALLVRSNALDEMPRQTESVTWPYVHAFAQAMEFKLREGAKRYGDVEWKQDHPLDHFDHMLNEVKELAQELGFDISFYAERKTCVVRDRAAVMKEAADVANHLMMLCDRIGAISLRCNICFPENGGELCDCHTGAEGIFCACGSRNCK